MTTAFGILVALAGLSHREAAEFLGVRLDTVKSWSSGRNKCPAGAIRELRTLILRQQHAAAEVLAQIERLASAQGASDVIELGEPIDDAEAQSLGWPCVGAWRAMTARVVAGADRQIVVVPRDPTPATSCAHPCSP